MAINIQHMFKKAEEGMTMLRRNMENPANGDKRACLRRQVCWTGEWTLRKRRVTLNITKQVSQMKQREKTKTKKNEALRGMG